MNTTKLPVKKTAFLAVLTAVSLTACSSIGPAAAGDPTGSGSTAASVAASPGPASGTAAPASAAPVPSVKPDQIQTRLTDFQLISDAAGFAWGETNGSLRLYRTDDGGRNWTLLSPWDDTFKSGAPLAGGSLYFLDAQHGWTAAADDGRKTVTAFTADGGQSWTKGTLDKPTYAAGLSFADPLHGWMLTSSDAAMGKSEKTLYATDNGGKVWKPLTSVSLDKPVPGALPLSGHASGMTFKDAASGWIALAGHEEKPVLYRTRDSGKTWNVVPMKVPQELNDSSVTLDGAPVFFKDEPDKGWIPVRTVSGNTESRDAYVTKDGGQTWSFKQTGMQNALTFADSLHGWGFKDKVLHATSDGGTTWNPVSSDPVLTDTLKNNPNVIRLGFAGPQTGWLLLGSEDGKKSKLLKTSDAGKHWILL
ncbi:MULTISPECIES: hypothetical protein [unclassified Paenibacillus]|uniref:WD40/YVTN/BNR-like repeat-containing protein n=1 Tax=unclassified Paenibacillus TaxID=185978 RepID=UPI00020D71F7|nr:MULTISPECIES: hypothetical protein [unclassified Paenibacillus]EGL18834.1 BNR/Asp-box repeat protein [Paenibacillus sp. HGF7]EPD92736.1 hypothetical protein HMPREF1207_00507 [Paenibacillus sp. HGH0039]